MLLTEQEARKKWCPMARHPEGNRVPYGGDGTASSEEDKKQFALEMADLHPCIASDCMMWREAESTEFKARAEAEFRRTGKRLTPDTGYCGLAAQQVKP